MTLIGAIVIATAAFFLLPMVVGFALAPLGMMFGNPPPELLLLVNYLVFVAAVVLAVLYSHNWRLPPRLKGTWPPSDA